MKAKILIVALLFGGSLIFFATPASATSQPYNFQVYAYENSSSLGLIYHGNLQCQNTNLAPVGGIQVNTGDVVSGTATGQWSNETTYSLYGPNGSNRPIGDGNGIECTGYGTGFLVMKFVANNGTSQWINAGSNFSTTINQNGRLYFAYSDSDQTNNRGSVSVSLTVTPSTPTCTTHASKQCVGNSVYWKNSCGAQEDVFQVCSANQICQNAQCIDQNIVCSTNSQCGTNGYIGNNFCKNGDVYKTYKTWTCNNAGTSTSYCSQANEDRLQTDCTSNQTCNNGSCTQEDIGDCDSASDCGTSGYIGSNFCKNGDVYKSYRTYVCNNAGTSTSYCSNTSEDRLTDNCDADQTCSGGSCENDNHNNCDSHDYKQCSGNYLYWYDSCGAREGVYQYCSNGCYNNSCSGNNNNCTSNSYQQCSGNYLYWYDSCGNRGGVSQYCQNGCSNNSCQNVCTGYNCNNNNNCVNFSYKQCVGNNIYWYDSCGVQRDLYQTCYGSNICQSGACITVQPVQPIYPTYTAHYRTSCYGNNVYWYSSLGAVNSIYKNCADTNSCTVDACSGVACTNTLKCDGTTCATSSADYNTYCKSGSNTENSSILFSLFAKKDASAVQWDKSVEVKSNETAYFLMTVENNSQENIQSVKVSADIPLEIASLGNLKVNDVSVSGDIVAGIDVGPLASGVLKRVTFEGKSGVITTAATKQVNAKVEFNGISQPDILSVNFSTATVAGALTEAKSSSWIVTFLKRWYLWILGLLVLIFLFVVIFRRLSSN